MIAPGELEACARRVYELHRARDLRRRRSSEGRIPTWDELDEPTRSRLIAAYGRTRSSYDLGRQLPREVRIDQPLAAPRQAASRDTH